MEGAAPTAAAPHFRSCRCVCGGGGGQYAAAVPQGQAMSELLCPLLHMSDVVGVASLSCPPPPQFLNANTRHYAHRGAVRGHVGTGGTTRATADRLHRAGGGGIGSPPPFRAAGVVAMSSRPMCWRIPGGPVKKPLDIPKTLSVPEDGDTINRQVFRVGAHRIAPIVRPHDR